MRYVFFGRSRPPSVLVLNSLGRRHRLLGVVESQPHGARPESRARARFSAWRGLPSLRAVAERARVPYFFLTPDKTAELGVWLDALAPDAGCIFSMAQLLPPEILERFIHGVFNAHPSLLPAYRGPCPTFWQYYNGEQQGGVTVQLIDAGEDTGDIVAQSPVSIAFGEPASAYDLRCAKAAAQLLQEALDALEAGHLTRHKQLPGPSPFRARKIQPTEQLIDWSWPIDRVFHVMCGALETFDPVPPLALPASIMRWVPVGFTRRAKPHADPGAPHRHGATLALGHHEGCILLAPRFSFRQALSALTSVVSRGGTRVIPGLESHSGARPVA